MSRGECDVTGYACVKIIRYVCVSKTRYEISLGKWLIVLCSEIATKRKMTR